MVCRLDRVATAAGCTVLCGLVVVVVLFENSIVCQCTFFKYFFHAPWHVDTAAVCVVVVLWCLLFVCTSSLRLHVCVCVVGCVNMNCFGCGGFSSSDAP